jgi:hypothetical protein
VLAPEDWTVIELGDELLMIVYDMPARSNVSSAVLIAKPAGGVIRDEEVVGSNPATPTSEGGDRGYA